MSILIILSYYSLVAFLWVGFLTLIVNPIASVLLFIGLTLIFFGLSLDIRKASKHIFTSLLIMPAVVYGGLWFSFAPDSPISSSGSSNSSSSSSSRSSGSIRSCLSGGERAYEACASNNPGGKGRLTCESNWKTKLRSCCNKYPIEATDELQCLSLY